MTATEGPTAFTTAGRSDRGRVRRRNEDAYLLSEELGLVAVADGVGGAPAGHVASRCAVEEMQRHLTENASASPGERLVEAVRSANSRIFREGLVSSDQAGMATTLTALLADPGEAVVRIVHVGDSRAYMLEGGRLRCLTQDHTVAARLVARGRMSPEEARESPYSHFLERTLGGGDHVEPDLYGHVAEPGQTFLLCTDGLTNMLTDTEIERALGDALPSGLDAAARTLVELANDKGGIDNITVALLRVDRAPQDPVSSARPGFPGLGGS
ncbi:MAG: protein phosphatase 2C domain-containing protein [Gemmatimonadota bacterium]|nr:protein phosphatase 2C domain-containing protein [Gemmatimonadota bacterium]